MEFKTLSDENLIATLGNLVQTEKRLTAEIVEYIKEVDVRRIYLKMGFSSLFQYLTESLGYTAASAQRRIDSARLMRELPEIKSEIQTGSLNLMQVSTLARHIREKQKQTGGKIGAAQKSEILIAIKSKDLISSQQTICKMLDLAPKTIEICRPQQDESVRVELTLTKEQTELLNQVKSLISHVKPNASITEILEYLAADYIKRKTFVRQRAAEKKDAAINNGDSKKTDVQDGKILTSKMEVKSGAPSRYVRSRIRKQLLQGQRCCQWVDKHTGRRCGSTFQPQIDHIQSFWAGGGAESDNLQILCGVHNRLKYERECGIRR